MHQITAKSGSSNRILASLTPEDFALLKPHLEFVDLPIRKSLEMRNRPIERVCFVESGFVSVVAGASGDRTIEVGIIGAEGMTGLAVVMGADRSSNDTYVQLAGAGQWIAASDLRRAIERSVTLHRALLRYGYAFMMQTSQTAFVNGRSTLEERLARWLLMAHDRVSGDEMPLTHEFLALMLGVRRPGVTVALNLLERRGLIATERGNIRIIDRGGLEETSNNAYGVIEAEYRGLFD